MKGDQGLSGGRDIGQTKEQKQEGLWRGEGLGRGTALRKGHR